MYQRDSTASSSAENIAWFSIRAWIFATAISGITFAAIAFGAQSAGYYVAALAFIPIAVSQFIKLRIVAASAFWALSAVCFLPILLFGLQSIDPPYYLEYPSFLTAASISTVILFASAIAALPAGQLRAAMALISLAHLLFCFYGLTHWGSLVEESRFSALNVHTAVWAEIALAAVFSAVIARNFMLVIIAMLAAAPIFVATQMRGASIAALASILIYFYSLLPRRLFFLYLLAAIAVVVAIISYNVQIAEYADRILLLSDSHRGVESGFSGRLDNWYTGFDLFLESPLIGSSIGDPTVRYTHNGLIMAFAELGIMGGLIFGVGLVVSLGRSLRYGYWVTLPVIAGYFLFIQTAPRYINLSSCVMIALAMVIRGMLHSRSSGQRSSARQPVLQKGGALRHKAFDGRRLV